MFLRIIAFLVGFISVAAGIANYDSELATAPVPLILGGLVIFLAVFNLLPQFKKCVSCGKKIPAKSAVCRFCSKDQPAA